MSTTEAVLLIILAALVVLVLGNIAFQVAAERKHPPIGTFIECDGVRLHYIERGNSAAPCVALFHGNGTMIQDFVLSGLVDRLAHNYRVICFDRPGFGYSHRPRPRLWTAITQAALFAKALDQLGVRNPVVLGHSWGTLVSIALALKSDYAVNGLVLVSGYYFPTPPLGFLAYGSSGSASAWRSDALHDLADHIVGHHAEADAHVVRAARHSAGSQERISDLVIPPAQAVEGGRRGERAPCSNCGPVAASI
jgi:pimeloyl-ACP methyl ester carboxylesterase